MRTTMSLDELAALVRLETSQIEEWADAGLLDPERDERFDDLDLLRLMAIRHYEALGYESQRLAQAIASGEVEPFLAEYIYPREARLTIEQAAGRSGTDEATVRELLTSLGWIRPWFLEGDLRMLEGFKLIAASGIRPRPRSRAHACSATRCAAWPRPLCASSTSTSTSD